MEGKICDLSQHCLKPLMKILDWMGTPLMNYFSSHLVRRNTSSIACSLRLLFSSCRFILCFLCFLWLEFLHCLKPLLKISFFVRTAFGDLLLLTYSEVNKSSIAFFTLPVIFSLLFQTVLPLRLYVWDVPICNPPRCPVWIRETPHIPYRQFDLRKQIKWLQGLCWRFAILREISLFSHTKPLSPHIGVSAQRRGNRPADPMNFEADFTLCWILHFTMHIVALRLFSTTTD